MFIEQRQPRDQDRSLQKSREAKPYDLLAPLIKAVQISAWDAEHIQTANRDLDEQDAAALQVCKEYLDDRIRHEDDAKQHHDRAGDRTETADVRGGKIREVLNGQLVDDISGNRAEARARTTDGISKIRLQGHAKLIKPDRYNRKKTDRHESLDEIHGCSFDVGPAGRVFQPAFRARDHEADRIQNPSKIREKQDDALHPAHFKHLGSHVAHLCKEVCKEADDLLVDPVHDLLQNRVGYKIPDKQAASPAFSF